MTNLDTLKAQLAAARSEWDAGRAAANDLRAMDTVQNEGGEGFSARAASLDQLADKYGPQVMALESAIFAAEWTLELTQARRAAWNVEMQKLIAAKTPATPKTIGSIARMLGYNFADLVRAKTHHAI